MDKAILIAGSLSLLSCKTSGPTLWQRGVEYRLEYLEKEVRVAQCGNVINYCLHDRNKDPKQCQVDYEQCIIRLYGDKK